MGLTVFQYRNGDVKAMSNLPKRKATVSLDNKTLKRSLVVHFQSYPLALAEKEQLATASALFGNYDSTQSATPILVTRNAEPIRRNSGLIRQNIRFRNSKCIQSDRSILRLSVQGLVHHIIISISSSSWSDSQIDACLLSPLPVPPLTDGQVLSHMLVYGRIPRCRSDRLLYMHDL